MNKRDKTVCKKILRYCDEIEETHRFFQNDEQKFLDKEQGFIYRNAVTMAVLQIGELAKRLSDDFLQNHSAIPWRQIIRTRDVYAHHYGSVDYDVLWDTSHGDINDLKAYLTELVNESSTDER